MRLLIKIASRERPKWLMTVLKACDALLSHEPDRTRILLSLDSDDMSMDGFQPPVMANVPITMVYGSSTSKVDAINRDIDAFLWRWDVVMVLSDDMVPVLKHFDTFVLQKMSELFQHRPLDGSLWLNDSRQKRLCTIPIMGRKLWERRGKQVYNRAYLAYYCDDEETDRGLIEGSIVHLPIDVARHDHAMFGTRPEGKDDLLRRNQGFKKNDLDTYKSRRKHGYART